MNITDRALKCGKIQIKLVSANDLDKVEISPNNVYLVLLTRILSLQDVFRSGFSFVFEQIKCYYILRKMPTLYNPELTTLKGCLYCWSS